MTAYSEIIPPPTLADYAMQLEVLSIQPENRKPVSGVDFANGARIQPDEKFGSVVDN